MRTNVLALAAATVIASSSAALADNFYVGAFAGPNTQQGHSTTTTIFSPVGYFASTSPGAIATTGSQSINTSGLNVGALAGYTWQFDPNWFAGFEVDFGVNSDNDTVGGSGTYPCCAPTGFAVSSKVSTN